METLLKEPVRYTETGTTILEHETQTDVVVKKYKEAIQFIELLEALTFDHATASRIRSFLTKEGIWKPLQQKN
jgi:hypothetical protein